MIDGCSSLGAFVRVVLPVVRPGVFTAALFTFLFAYNEFLYCLILTGNNAKPPRWPSPSTAPEKIEYWSWSAAGAVGILAPIVLFIGVMQRAPDQGAHVRDHQGIARRDGLTTGGAPTRRRARAIGVLSAASAYGLAVTSR